MLNNKKTILGFTGTQTGMTDKQKQAVSFFVAHYFEFHHGDCIGADADFHEIVRNISPGGLITVHPPLVKDKQAFCVGDIHKKPLPYLERDRRIVDAVEHLLATPRLFTEEHRSGTWYTIRYARKSKKPITIFWPDGSRMDEG